MDGTTACVVLGVQPGASQHMIKKAFRRLAQSAHPDVSGSATEFRRLKTAFDVAIAGAALVDTALVDTALAGAPMTAKASEPQIVEVPEPTQRSVTPPAATPVFSQTQQARPSGSSWLTGVLTDFPPTARYESLVGMVRERTQPTAAQLRHENFSKHLEQALAAA